MAVLDGNLWEYNLCKVVVVDVSDDYATIGPPLPADCYPVLAELWVPRYGIGSWLPFTPLVQGYLYDWHLTPIAEEEPWTVGVVRYDLDI
ncbi:MAG TPA: hypothetical protein PLL78_11820 [Fimbriimonadaceae bacterium]|nr:hypothetical protein [Fimbriimonadaceae bacterium]HRJ97362.1 hypothetical protein [Fimbriimonadaceae bacterium]